MAWLKTEGDYMFRVKRTNKTLRENAKGNSYIFLALEVAEGPNKGEETEWKGYLSGGAFDITLKTLERAFFGGAPFSDLYGMDEGRVSFVDKLVPGKAAFEEYQGKNYLKVSLSAPEDSKISAGKLAQLDAQAKARAVQAIEDAKPVMVDEDHAGSVLPF